MAHRENASLVISRQSILLVTAVGVGLLTLTYVLGVQVGKQSSAVRQSLPRGAGESLAALPAPIQEQMKGFEATAVPAAQAAAAPALPEGTPAALPVVPAPASPPKAPPPEEAPAKKEEGPKWTLQFMSTPDSKEAQRLVDKLKGAGYPATIVKEKGVHKVRLVKGGSRDSLDRATRVLKDKGFKPFAVRAE